MAELTDEALVVRGGQNLPTNFAKGSGVLKDVNGLIRDVSVNCALGKTVAELSRTILNNQVGVTSIGRVRAVGGLVVPSPTRVNPDHCLLSGIDAVTASRLFNPTVPNPGKVE